MRILFHHRIASRDGQDIENIREVPKGGGDTVLFDNGWKNNLEAALLADHVDMDGRVHLGAAAVTIAEVAIRDVARRS